MVKRNFLLKVFTAVLVFYGVAANSYDGCNHGYPDQGISTYIMPFTLGNSYVVGQGNCTDGSHEIGSDQAYAYDFDMPIGSQIVASRAGVVVELQERFVDGNGTRGQENYIILEHYDKEVSGYYHLTKNGLIPVLGAQVAQGEVIATSGNTGDSTEPHLHFEVLKCLDCDTIPINFSNTRLHVNGLIEGQTYRAEVFQELNPNVNSIASQLLLFL